MDIFDGVSSELLLLLVVILGCGCSGRGSLVDGLVRRRPGGLRTDGDG